MKLLPLHHEPGRTLMLLLSLSLAATPYLFVGLSVVLFVGCDSSTSENEAKGPTAEARLQAAEEAMEAARAAGAETLAKEDFEYQMKKLEEARELVEGGKGEKARSKLISAERGFKDLVAKSEEAKKTQGTALEAKKKAEKTVAAAKAAKLDLAAKDVFDEIATALASAQADLDSGNPKKVESATRAYGRIPELVQRARTVSQESKRWQEKADTQKKATLAKEGEAKAAKAEQFAPEDLTRAQQSVREADLDYKDGRFREAFEAYRSAENVYTEAITRARSEEELAKMNTPPPPVPTEAEPRKEEPGVAAGPAPGGQDTSKPDVGEVPPPAPGEISADDELFLNENVKKFCSKVEPLYDPGTGILTVEYPFGDQLRKDIVMAQGPIPEKHIRWKDIIGGVGSKQAQGKKELGLSFHGNTRGFFLIPIPFKDEVTIEYQVELGLMKTDGVLTPVLMAAENGKSFIGANFGTVEVWRDSRLISKKGPNDPKLQKSPNTWFNKTKIGGVGMKIVYKPHPDGKRGLVEIWYDTEEEPDAPLNAFPVPARSGMVGFSWVGTAYNIRLLKISGKLDKPAAVKLLREKLGKSGPGGEGEGGGQPGGGSAPAGGASEKASAPAPAPKGSKTGSGRAADGKVKDGADY